MKKVIKYTIIILLLFITMFTVFSNFLCTYAVEDVRPGYYEPTYGGATSEFTKKVGIVLGTIRNISVVVSVIVLMIIGLKYILGSVEEKANYKETLVPYLIGAVMAMAGTTVVSFIYNAVHS